MTRLPVLVSAAALAAVLSGCSGAAEAPADPGLCWNMVKDEKGAVGGRVIGGYRFFQVGGKVADLEHCAAALDAMRTRFLALGGSTHKLIGAYQGEFLFITGAGAFAATSMEAPPFPLLRRTDEGKLTPPSAPVNP